MKKIEFTTMFGAKINIEKDFLLQEHVKKIAEKHFKQEVLCTPCAFGTGSIAFGWQIANAHSAEIIAYVPLTTGMIMDYPDDFEYGVATVIPLCSAWTQVCNFQMRFVNGEIEICKCK